MAVLVVIPTYNEADNIGRMVRQLCERGYGVLVVDDGSPDDTAEIAYAMGADVLQRGQKLGLGTAYADGFREALMFFEAAEYIVQMDADFSHDPAEIPVMLMMAEHADVIVGSRYCMGGSTPGWSWRRRMLSKYGNAVLRRRLGLRACDVSSGFKVFRRKALLRLMREPFESQGYGFQTEMAVRCQELGLTIIEHPIAFQERKAGASKMSAGILIETARKLLF